MLVFGFVHRIFNNTVLLAMHIVHDFIEKKKLSGLNFVEILHVFSFRFSPFFFSRLLSLHVSAVHSVGSMNSRFTLSKADCL